MERQIDPLAEKLYNVRDRVPNFLEIFQQWRERSDTFKAQHDQRHIDIRYGDAPKSTLDLFLPDGAKDATVPVHVFIHGGYWKAMDKADFSFIAEPFIAEGVAVAVVNYDLCPDVDIFHILNQMREAICWFWEQGEEHGIDPHAIHVSGHSAGGQLVGMLMCTDWQSFKGHHVPNTVIQSCLSISGLFDLSKLIYTTINNGVELTPQTATELSPLNHPVISTSPILCSYGELEGEGFAEQSNKMVQYCKGHTTSAGLLPVENATHFDVVDHLADPNSPTFKWAISQIK